MILMEFEKSFFKNHFKFPSRQDITTRNRELIDMDEKINDKNHNILSNN